MSDNCDEIDSLIIYDIEKDSDSGDILEYQELEERVDDVNCDDNVDGDGDGDGDIEEEEEEEEHHIHDSTLNTYIIASNIEALDDEEILQEHMLQTIEIDENENIDDIDLVEIKSEYGECEEEEVIDDDNEVNDDSQISKRKHNKNEDSAQKATRYLLFDDLIATIVEYDEDDTPIVQFSLCTTPDAEKLPIECGICPDVMPKSKLQSHLKMHLVPGTNLYKCIYCTKAYKDYKYLASHARRHKGIRPYVCEICKLYFSTKQDMRVHNQRRHLKKEHICEVCGKTFSQNTMLKRHRESTHEKKRRFQCEHCPKAYYKNFSLQEHIRSVHMGQRRMLKCPFCGMQCLDAHKMARHRKLWHLNQEQFVCEICQEKFTNVNYFDAHKRSIQCRNNTRRKMEDEQRQQQEQQKDDNTDIIQYEEEIDDHDKDMSWQVQEAVEEYEEEDENEPLLIGEVYDENEQYVELVLPGNSNLVEDNTDNIFQQDGDVVFEITLDSNENN